MHLLVQAYWSFLLVKNTISVSIKFLISQIPKNNLKYWVLMHEKIWCNTHSLIIWSKWPNYKVKIFSRYRTYGAILIMRDTFFAYFRPPFLPHVTFGDTGEPPPLVTWHSKKTKFAKVSRIIWMAPRKKAFKFNRTFESIHYIE